MPQIPNGAGVARFEADETTHPELRREDEEEREPGAGGTLARRDNVTRGTSASSFTISGNEI